MSVRELVVLGTASQAPTRRRNHNGYVLLWDGHGVLFDPGEGTQRQMLRAGVAAHDLHRLCVTHFHGDHSLGLAGVIQRLNLDAVPHPVTAHYPASGRHFFERLRYASAYRETVALHEQPVAGAGELAAPGGEPGDPPFTLYAHRLDHRIETYGYRLAEPDGRRMLPRLLAERGIEGADIARLQRAGELRGVRLEEVSEPRPGQRFAFAMDTRLCDGVYELADGCDLLVVEATFLDEDAALAEEYGHLTAGQAARVAAESGVRSLVLTHFSQRYRDPAEFGRQARKAGFQGELTVAEDLVRVPVPKRRA